MNRQYFEMVVKESNARPESYSNPNARPLTVYAIGFAGKLALRSDFSMGQYLAQESSLGWMRISDWPEGQAERLMAYYERYFSRAKPRHTPTWNGHSTTASIAGLDVRWLPSRMPTGLVLGETRSPTELISGQPYLLTKDGEITHSVIGLPDGNVLNTPGRGAALQVITANAIASTLLGDTFHDYQGLKANPQALAELTWVNQGMYDLPNPIAN